VEKTWYKIVEVDKSGKIKSLFHGTNGSRFLQINSWLTADIKLAKDGSSKTRYLAGWHIIPTYKECKEYLTKFKNLYNKKIVKCRAKVIWPKTHSKSNVFLSKYIFIEEIVDERM
jgi:hypothetical protein